MQRYTVALFCSILLILTMAACGGGSDSKQTPTVTASPSVVSLDRGRTFQLTLSATDDRGNTVLTDYTFSSSNPELVSVASDATVCAGKWDTNGITCTPATTTGKATLTVSGKNGGSATVDVYVHERVDAVQVTAPADCVSTTETLQLAAKALSHDPAVCGGASSCELPTATVGNFSWGSSDSAIVTIDNTKDKSGLATAAMPGRTRIYAALSGVVSPSVLFTTCPVTELSVAVTDGTATPLALDKSGTKGFTATVKDSKGKAIASPTITWYTTNLYGVNVSAASPAVTATVTATNSGTSGAVGVFCANPNCNRNLDPVFGNLLTVNTNGTLNAPTIYVASTQSKTLIPIDGSSNTVGTAITLPRSPNSIAINRTGSRVLLGTDDGGVLLVDTATNALSSFDAVTGAKVYATSPDASLAYAANSTTGWVINLSSSSIVTSFSIANTTDASFGPDNRLLIANGSPTFYMWQTGGSFQGFTAPGSVTSTSVYANGSFAYLAHPGAVSARATCRPDAQIDSQTATTPTIVRALPNGGGAAAVDLPNLILINNTTTNVTCPPVVTESSTPFDLGIGTPTARQLVVAQNGTKAVVTSNTSKLAVANLTNATAAQVTLGASATEAYKGDITADAKLFYVGASDGTVHRIDLSNNTDAQQIAVNLKKADNSAAVPDLVVVRNK